MHLPERTVFPNLPQHLTQKPQRELTRRIVQRPQLCLNPWQVTARVEHPFRRRYAPVSIEPTHGAEKATEIGPSSR